VAAYPWEDHFDPDYRIFLSLNRFDGNLGGAVNLDVNWTVTSRDSQMVLLSQKSVITKPSGGADFEAFVSAQSRALGELSREMARGITGLISAAGSRKSK
jgi:uncharacterized lipoprotein YmbA